VAAQGTTQTETTKARGFDLRHYIEMARRRIAWVVLPAIGVFLCTVVVARRLPDVYRSETVILVDAQQVPANIVASTVSSTIQDRLATIQQQVMSPSRLKRMIDKLGLYPQLRGQVSTETLVHRIQKATLIDVALPADKRLSSFKISFESESPVDASRVANELAATFMAENLKARESQFVGTAEFLENELQDTKKELEAKERELQAVKTTNILDLPEAKQIHIEALNNLRMQMTASQDRVNRAQQDKMILQSMMSTTAPTVDLDAGGGPNVNPYQAQIQKQEAHLSELQARYGPSFPDVRKAQAELERLKKKAADAEAQMAAAPQADPIIPKKRNPVIEGQLQKLGQEIEDQLKLQADLQQQVNFHTAKLERVPVFEQRISSLMRDYDSLKIHYQALLDKRMNAQMASELEEHQKAEKFVVLDPAPIPEKPYGPNRALISLAGLLGGLFAGFGLMLVAETNDDSVRSEAEASKLLGLPVLAEIPQMEAAAQVRNRMLVFAGSILLTAAGSAGLGLLISRFAI
jgi:succinoglycan biosynthesis transport protein ExoP